MYVHALPLRTTQFPFIFMLRFYQTVFIILFSVRMGLLTCIYIGNFELQKNFYLVSIPLERCMMGEGVGTASRVGDGTYTSYLYTKLTAHT